MMRYASPGRKQELLPPISSPDMPSQHLALPLMPANVKPGQVRSLVEIIDDAGGEADVHHLAMGLGADLTSLPAVLLAAEVLGLTRRKDERIWLTTLGTDFLMAPDKKLSVLRSALAALEPFRTALELASKAGLISSKQLVRALDGKGIRWDYRHDENSIIVNNLMIDWSIFAGLFKHTKSQEFLKLV